MELYRCITEIPEFPQGTTVTLGVFDGLHNGHMQIINQTIEAAGKNQTPSVLVSFEPHPRNVIASASHPLQRLTTFEEKVELLQKTKLDAALFLRTDEKLLATDAETFIKTYLKDGLNVKEVVVGFDYHFGKNREGNPVRLAQFGKQLGFDVQIVPSINMDDHCVRSSVIRQHLLDGTLQTANKLLGSSYQLRGKIVSGSARGRQLGFPTANVNVDHPEKLVPANGVYFVRVRIQEHERFGICNIGVRPTFHETERKIEIFILDVPERDLYDEVIMVEFLEYIRPEIQYKNKEELIRQMQIDEKLVKEKINKLYF